MSVYCLPGGSLQQSSNNDDSHMCRGPECFQEDGEVTGKTDIWALGCTLLEMCSGEVFPAGTSTGVMIGQLKEQKGPEVPASVPKCLASIIQQCLHADPQERPTASQVQQVGHTVCLYDSFKTADMQHCKTYSGLSCLVSKCSKLGNMINEVH